jgi:hypothetical protein
VRILLVVLIIMFLLLLIVIIKVATASGLWTVPVVVLVAWLVVDGNGFGGRGGFRV